MLLLHQKVLMEKCTVLSNLKTIMEEEKFEIKEGKVPTRSVSVIFHLLFGHISSRHICNMRMFRELAFCEVFLGSIGFLCVYDIHFAFENTSRV